jgi:hypothetical protein
MMYAQSKRSQIYHLLYSTFEYTLCGQKTKKVDLEGSAEGTGLRLVSEQPPNRMLCKQCDRMEQRTNGNVMTRTVGTLSPLLLLTVVLGI